LPAQRVGATTPGNLNINGAPDSVTLAPGNYVVGNWSLNQHGSLNIQPPGQVRTGVTLHRAIDDRRSPPDASGGRSPEPRWTTMVDSTRRFVG